MRRIIIVLILFVSCSVKAQEVGHFSLFTDRDLYTSGETILLKIFAPDSETSGIMHLDLINSGGQIITKVNKKIADNQVEGYILLPDSMKTGTYFICASTNTNPIVSVKELFVCNRFTGLAGTTSMMRPAKTDSIVEKQGSIEIEGIGKAYHPGDKAQVILHLSPEVISSIKGDLFVSVAECTAPYSSNTFLQKINPIKNQEIESKGITLKGIVKDQVTGAAFKNGCVFLSIPDSIPGLDYFITGEDGRFSFQVDNYYTKIPIVIQGFDLEKKRNLKIVLDQRDSLTGVVPSYASCAIPSNFKTLTNNNIEATTLQKIFENQLLTLTIPLGRRKKDYPFYGVPNDVIYPNLFVDLPDFTEIARELLLGVKFRTYNRVPTMQILNPQTLNYFNEQPLVLLNGIPVQDLNMIKNMGSKDIERIEICRNERFYGDLAFSGVVAIYTAKRDLKQLVESDDLIKLNLDVLQPNATLNVIDKVAQNEPNLRKVLLWKPMLKPADSIKIDFVTCDILGSYKLIVRYKSKDGSVNYNEQIFEVN